MTEATLLLPSIQDDMGYDPRWIPTENLIEVTCRVMQARFLLRPSKDLNEILTGVLAKAAHRYPVGVVAFHAMSNHLHLLVVPEDAQALSSFMGFFAGNLAKEAGRLYGWKEKFWGRRYSHVVISDEPEAQEDRLRYLLSQGCKEGLVRRPQDWPGACSTEALLTGGAIQGVWFDRSAEYEACRSAKSFSKYDFADVLDLKLTPLPAWAHLTRGERRERTGEIVHEITQETRQRIEESGRAPLGVRRILRQDPHQAPANFERSPRPLVHALASEVREKLKEQFRLFRTAYREASLELRSGNSGAEFPPGCHRPRLPFVRGHPPPVTT